MPNHRTVFIVGAGFSANAGLPLQSEFTELFLGARDYKRRKRLKLMEPLDRFVEDTFGFDPEQKLELYPALEDLFTMLDLSANTGHHLGLKYPPKTLRSLRRMLLSRIISMLYSAYLENVTNRGPERAHLIKFVRSISEKKHQFVSLNWDVVLEGCLYELKSPLSAFYSPQIFPVRLEASKVLRAPRGQRRLLIAKMHGSINWLYCDCCRRTFSVPIDQVTWLASQVLKGEEERKLYGDAALPRLMCPDCRVDLGVRLATFSYQKALRTHMFESSWMEAEKALRSARKWVFIGYSLPGADFEFKYLLKRIALSRRSTPIVQVVTKDRHGAKGDSPTVASYKRFLGECRPEFFREGLTSDTIARILE